MEDVMATPSPRPWTYEEYCLLPEDGNRYEIIDGELFMTPAPKVRHQDLVLSLSIALAAVTPKGGRLLNAPCDVYLTETNNVQPDVLYIAPDRALIVTEANVQGAPSLVVEILSASTRKQDEVLKRNLYERFGVQEYWIVDPELDAVKVYRMDSESRVFGEPEILSAEKDHRLSTQLLPGLDLSLSDLLATE